MADIPTTPALTRALARAHALAACLQYGHTALRWLPLHGPLLRRRRTHRPYVLVCLDCGATIRRTRAHPASF